jgi:hypothetical protein
VEHAKGKESQSIVVEFLLVDTRRNTYKNLSHLGEFIPPKYVERFSKRAINSSTLTS